MRLSGRLSTGLVIGIIGSFGLWELFQGGWIHMKALLAQRLLRQAWEETIERRTTVKPWPWADTVPIARLIVPRLRIDEIVLSGANGRTLAFGPAYYEGSARPGMIGVSVITGHRDTHFGFLRRLEPDDRINVQTAQDALVGYRVLGSSVSDGRLPFHVSEEDGHTLLPVTCYPFDALVPGGPLRYVVMAEMSDG
ncbi:Class GN sortase [Nitrospira tepida]|uniref:Class GN sortase n=1 Tax=Nitrospira tepida TaxID=2973512 RepID=A0AA86MZH0_9BACT|nr:class GN sortase [Nitrospira tepida]CAI4031904.1 Class GN sortase [Nitrospira tepida]